MSAVARALTVLVRGYQLFLSTLLPPACRFEPSCSEYYRRVLRGHGALRGSWLAVKRVARCHPWHFGGYDPPPAPRPSERPGV